MTTFTFAQTPPVETGVSNTLAKWRAANYSDVRYKLNIALEKMAPLLKGEIEIRVKVTEEGAKHDLILDWRETPSANDKDKHYARVLMMNGATFSTSTPRFENEHIIIPKESVIAGENVFLIEFASPIKSSGAAVTRYVDKEDGAEYVYSLFVPSDASTAFPVFDQPDLKARFQLNLETPAIWEAVSNTPYFVGSAFDLKDKDRKKSFRFSETKPISTYVFAFAAGDFAEVSEPPASAGGTTSTVSSSSLSKGVSANSNVSIAKLQPPADAGGSDLPMKIYVRKSQAGKFKQHAAEIFRLNREGVKFLEEWFDYKFPFPKYDLVLIPEFPFGGMEHAGATFLREDRVIFPTEPTKNDYITRANLIFHEAAHQWFGDTVTMRWFDDLWLKEGFAEFMAYKTLEKVLPEYNAWKIFYERNKQAAYLTDVTRGTTPIYQEIPNLSSAKSAYGNIVYRKAPSFLRQAEFYLGEKEFQTAVRAFLKKHEFANAEWTDLVSEFETASKQDLSSWAKGWVAGRGVTIFRPIIFGSGIGTKPDDRNYRILQQNSIDERSWLKEKTQVLIIQADNSIRKTEFIHPNSITGDFILIKESDKFVFPNYQDYGYGIFLLDEKSRAYVLENINAEKDDFLRSMMWGSLWDSLRFYELAPEEYVKLVIENLELSNRKRRPASVDPRLDPKYVETYPETDESTISTLLNRVGTAMNYYLSEEQREKLAPRLEAALIEKMTMPWTPQGEQITAFRALTNLASTMESRQRLKGLLNREKEKAVKSDFEKLYSLPPLKTKDRFDIVTRLLILGDEDAPRLLAELEKNETGDAAKRYAYAARAGIATAENKAKYWNDFVNNKEISESYIESAFAVWNTPRHSELTLPYLEKALAELPNLKKNRKIFFVNGWLGAFIGGQKSEQALKIVNKFLADNSNLDIDLRRKILENSDNLERAVKIREKFGK